MSDPVKRPTFDEWVAIYKSLPEEQRQKLLKLAWELAAQNEGVKS